LRPDLPAAVLDLRVRTRFGAVHGVVHLALPGGLVGIREAAPCGEVAALVVALVAGAPGRVAPPD
jgi:hypothetical protein